MLTTEGGFSGAITLNNTNWRKGKPPETQVLPDPIGKRCVDERVSNTALPENSGSTTVRPEHLKTDKAE